MSRAKRLKKILRQIINRLPYAATVVISNLSDRLGLDEEVVFFYMLLTPIFIAIAIFLLRKWLVREAK